MGLLMPGSEFLAIGIGIYLISQIVHYWLVVKYTDLSSVPFCYFLLCAVHSGSGYLYGQSVDSSWFLWCSRITFSWSLMYVILCLYLEEERKRPLQQLAGVSLLVCLAYMNLTMDSPYTYPGRVAFSFYVTSNFLLIVTLIQMYKHTTAFYTAGIFGAFFCWILAGLLFHDIIDHPFYMCQVYMALMIGAPLVTWPDFQPPDEDADFAFSRFVFIILRFRNMRNAQRST